MSEDLREDSAAESISPVADLPPDGPAPAHATWQEAPAPPDDDLARVRTPGPRFVEPADGPTASPLDPALLRLASPVVPGPADARSLGENPPLAPSPAEWRRLSAEMRRLAAQVAHARA